MTLTPAQTQELYQMAAPLRTFLRTYCHPHCRIIVEDEAIEVVETVARTMDQKPLLNGDITLRELADCCQHCGTPEARIGH